MKQLAVIILNWNGRKLMEKYLPSVARHTCGDEVEVIVADNGSSDDSVAWLRENYPSLRVLELGENYGFAEGYNKAVAQTRFPYTLLLNSDVEVEEGWWQPLLAFMQANPRAGAVQPKIMSLTDRRKFEYAGAAGGYLDRLGYPYCRGRLFDSIEEDLGQYDGSAVEVCWASGAALLVRTELYERCGGLDPGFFAHMEEIDLCCRIWNMGYKVYACSDSKIYHLGGGSLHQGDPKKTYLNFRNNLLLLHKNLPEKTGKRRLILRRLADTLAWLMFMVKGDFANAGSVLRAHRDFRRMKKSYRSFPDADVLRTLPGYRRWIVIDRYLLGKKK